VRKEKGNQKRSKGKLRKRKQGKTTEIRGQTLQRKASRLAVALENAIDWVEEKEGKAL